MKIPYFPQSFCGKPHEIFAVFRSAFFAGNTENATEIIERRKLYIDSTFQLIY